MKIEYAGAKPVINEKGVFFKEGKQDKFTYLTFSIDILNAINHEYASNKEYSSQINHKDLSSNEILDILLKFHPNLEETMNKEISSYLIHLDKEESEVSQRSLCQIEKDTYISNLKIMRDYKIQRAKNKIFYFHCIETIVETILKYKIKEIDTPFNERYWHILQTIEGKLSTQKISSNLKMIDENSALKAMLLINIY
jgi:hypothetical protein